MLRSTDGDRTLTDLLTEINDSADAYAMGRLLERRPDLDRPPEPRIPVPAEEDLRVSLDRLAFIAWLEPGLVLASDVPVAAVLPRWRDLGAARRGAALQHRRGAGALPPPGRNRQQPPVYGPWDDDSDAGVLFIASIVDGYAVGWADHLVNPNPAPTTTTSKEVTPP